MHVDYWSLSHVPNSRNLRRNQDGIHDDSSCTLTTSDYVFQLVGDPSAARFTIEAFACSLQAKPSVRSIGNSTENRVASEYSLESSFDDEFLGQGRLPSSYRARKQNNSPTTICGTHRDALCKPIRRRQRVSPVRLRRDAANRKLRIAARSCSR